MTPLSPADSSPEVLRFLADRRSPAAKLGFDDGPTPEDITDIITRSARVPDHRKLGPWRFVVFDRESGRKFGSKLAARFAELHPDANEKALTEESGRLSHAPYAVAVIVSPKDCPRGTPIWEQELSAGALCFNMLLVARAKGFAAQWLTKWFAFDRVILAEMGLKPGEKIAGFMHIGVSDMAIPERPRPDIEPRITWA